VEPKIITSAAYKGGVGKTRLSYELAFLLGAPLIDFDYDDGGATLMWGYEPSQTGRATILDGFASNRTPRPLGGGGNKPDLVPSHPDVAERLLTVDPEDVRERVERWAKEWGREYVVVDTHPGYHPMTIGAIAASRLTLVPVTMSIGSVRALAKMVREHSENPIMAIPYRVPNTVPPNSLKMLEAIDVEVGPMVSENRHIDDRTLQIAITAKPRLRYRQFASEMREVAEAVRTVTK
jgi:chromosome partitioning protein